MRMIIFRSFTLIFVLTSLTACGSDKTSSQGQQGQGYKDTKSMVIDVLKSTEGQKAIMDAGKESKDKSTKLLATGEGQQIQLAVKEILTEDTGKKMLEKTMTDPKFAGKFAEAIQSNLKQIHKDLMKDPQYQKSMLEVMNNPEFQKILTTTMKNTVYRQQMMNVIQESMQSPLFKMQLMELLKKVVEEGITPKVETLKSSESGGKSGGDSGGKSGGDSGGEGGGGGDDSGSESSPDKNKDKKDE
ncbi:MAG: spore germination lipoprotein GerD [Paenibacillaceae bacterium]